MTYLTFEEYTNLSGIVTSEDEFNKLLKKVVPIFEVYTRHFYRSNDFESDFAWRKEAVKASIAFQVDYFNELGVTSYEGINGAPQMVVMGRTTVSQTSRFNATGNSEKKPLLCFESVMALQRTGLLYRGV